MPTIAVNKAELYRRLGREYTTEEFDELCFDYGLELDEDTTKEVEEAKKKGLPAGEPELKIEVPANRYDLVCLEGIARALRIFLGQMEPPKYALSVPAKMQEVYVEASTSPLRPYFASAILRLARPLNQLEYESFIALQDKLHQNLCRQRRFVAIGTHDLDAIEGPFRYMCRDPHQIKFAPLNREVESTAAELMVSYENDRHLGRYLHIIKDAPAYPIIYDSKEQVLSMPPIINSQHSRIIAGKTKNIFIDTTATDKTKLDIVINMVATMFAEYCEVPFVIEPVKIIMPDGSSHISPPLAPRATTASSSYMNAATGLSLTREEQAKLLTRMSLVAKPSASDPDALDLEIPCTRPDILHECDCMEDLAVSYGFNKLPKQMPRTNTVAKPYAVNKLADILRKECAMAGWTECLPLILCSHDENFAYLNRPDPGHYAISLANPASQEYQVVRTSLLPGLLKTARENKSLPLPMKIFEVSDVAVQDPREERQSRNYRRLAGLYMNKTASFESTHGLLDRIMQILGVPFLQTKDNKAEYGYWIEAADDATYLPGRGAKVFYRPKPSVSDAELAEPTPSTPPSTTAASSTASGAEAHSEKSKSGPLHTLAENLKSVLPGHHGHHHHSEKGSAEQSTSSSVTTAVKDAVRSTASATGSRDMVIGSLGILHPSVLGHFELARPCSCVEIDVEPLL